MNICELHCLTMQPSRLRCNVLRLGRIALDMQKIVSEWAVQGGAPGATASAMLNVLSSKEDAFVKHHNLRKGLCKLKLKSATFALGVQTIQCQ